MHLGSHENADICDDIWHCQAYKTREYALSCWEDEVENKKWGKIQKAVMETQGEVITYQGDLINAFFHAHSGGKTEDISNIWGQEKIPYLVSVEGLENTTLIDSISISYEELKKILKEKYSFSGDIEKPIDESAITILERNSSGRVAKIKILDFVLSGTDVRSLFQLRSTNFEILFDDNGITFQTNGYGHGVGMSQEGANAMALKGNRYDEIIKHYYTGVEIRKLSYDK